MANNKQKTIYVLCPSEQFDEEWDVIQWQEHPALAPHSGGRRKISTAYGKSAQHLVMLNYASCPLLSMTTKFWDGHLSRSKDCIHTLTNFHQRA